MDFIALRKQSRADSEATELRQAHGCGAIRHRNRELLDARAADETRKRTAKAAYDAMSHGGSDWA